MDRIVVSVVIPFYNNIKWLIEAVDSVFNQTFKDFEVIVVNDGANVDLSIFKEKYEHKIVYKYKENGGPASARNIGIELAKGKYIAFLDSDDIWYSQKLELQVKMMEKVGAIWSHTNYARFNDNNPELLKNYDLVDYSGNIFPKSLLSAHIATPCVMIRTDYIQPRKDLRFEEKMRFGQDYYLWLLLSTEIPLLLIPKVLCKVRLRGSNAAKRARAHIQVRAHIWNLLKNHSSKIFYKEKSFFIIRFIYILCKLEHLLLQRLEEGIKVNPRFVEFVSKVLFIFPYISFKILGKMYVNKNKNKVLFF